MLMKGLIIFFFPQKKIITEQVHNDAAMKILAGIKASSFNRVPHFIKKSLLITLPYKKAAFIFIHLLKKLTIISFETLFLS
jgi:hypothetical protein